MDIDSLEKKIEELSETKKECQVSTSQCHFLGSNRYSRCVWHATPQPKLPVLKFRCFKMPESQTGEFLSFCVLEWKNFSFRDTWFSCCEVIFSHDRSQWVGFAIFTQLGTLPGTEVKFSSHLQKRTLYCYYRSKQLLVNFLFILYLPILDSWHTWFVIMSFMTGFVVCGVQNIYTHYSIF